MSNYLPDHITEAHVYINYDGVPTMSALWDGKPWLFYWKDDPPTWVAYMSVTNITGMWEAMHSPRWQMRWLPPHQADMYHKLAFPSLAHEPSN